MTERYSIHNQLEHLQSKYVGAGNANTSKWEWANNQHRDTNAFIIGYPDLLSFTAITENESKAMVKFNLLKKMLQPCGPPPSTEANDE
ncbi:hypothetical protein SNEBB_003926 [Seison nebaliae]|nr:hypothetical protein SNEBB_003926 [Seison nebaliae]